MFKNNTLLLITAIFALIGGNAFSQCTSNTSAYGTATAPTDASVVSISTIQWQTEYSTINSVVAGNQYESTYAGGGCITVTEGSPTGTVIGFGNSPLTWTATVSGTYYVHYNTDCTTCGTASTGNESTIACLTCGTVPNIPPGGVPISTGGTVNTCTGTFYDSGGTNDYSPNEDYTITLCPDAPGQAIVLDFVAFDVEGTTAGDVFCLYDGLDNTAPTLGCYSNDSPLSGVVMASNPTGCVTAWFQSTATTNLAGWEANISCQTLCQDVIPDPTFSPAPAADGIIYLCQGDNLQMNGDAIFPQSGIGYTQTDATSTWDWSYMDGPNGTTQNFNHTFNDEGAYIVQLEITDIEGCSNTIDIDQYVFVSTTPIFAGSVGAPDPICAGDQAVMTGVVTPVTFEQICTPPTFPPLALPDGSGVSYQTSVNLDCYLPGQTLDDVNDLIDICVNMEHSYMGDLEIAIECPDGTQVLLVDYPNGGGGTFLGVPVDDDAQPTVQGTGFDYCWSPSATNGDWANNTGGTLAAGTYESTESLAGLVGCPMNGDWTIIITDNLSSDNGFIFNWGINFDPGLLTTSTTFTPTIVSTQWQADPTIVSGTNPVTVEPTTAGSACYVFEVTDDFGCNYDTTVCITVDPSPIIDPIADIDACTDVTLPAITGTNLTGNQAYYTGTMGTGTQYNPGDVITGPTTLTLFIYDEMAVAPFCDDEESFVITITPLDVNAGPDLTYCSGAAAITIGNDPVSTVEGATYTWDNAAGTGTIDLTGGTQDNGQVTVSPASTTTYTVTMTLGACVISDDMLVTVDLPPTASNPANINVECIGDVPAPDVTVVTDENDDITIPPTVTHVGDVSDGLSCPETITRTYRVTDACGNFVDVQQLIIIEDVTNPVFAAAPADVTVECSGDVPAMTDLAWTDNCDGAGTVTGTDGALIGGTCGGTITRTWTYTDACGNTATMTQTITVNDTQAPVFAVAPADVTVECSGDVPAMTDLAWTDNCDGAGTVTGTDGTLTGGTCGGTITRTWTYTDACGNTATTTQTITVNDTQAPVFAAAPADITVECSGDVPAMTDLAWTDNCDGAGTVTGTDGALTGGTCGGTITRTWTYTDACGNTATATQTITVNDTQAPVFAAPPADVTVECVGDVPVMTDLAWTDNCDGAGTVTGTDGALTGGPCGGTITRTWTYTDACGNIATVTQTITVDDTTPPTASNPAPISVAGGTAPAPDVTVVTDEADNCGVPTVAHVSDVSDGGVCPETITRTYSVTDACGNSISVTQIITIGDAILPTASNPIAVNVECSADVPTPDPLVVTDEADNGAAPVVTWEDDTSDGNSCPETIARRYRVTDDCGNFIFVTQTITINDITAPVLNGAPADVTVECIGDVPVMTDLGWTDNCDGTGTVTGTDVSDGLSCPETITRTWSYTDACGNAATQVQTITVIDTQAPVFGAPPANLTVQCTGDVPAIVDLDWTDNCDGTGTVTGVEVSDGLSCPETITRTWTYTDACGNTATETQTIIVHDTQVPVFNAAPANVTVECIGDVPAMTDLGWTDNCDGTGTVTGNDVSDGLSCPETITRTWTYTDACGNTATETQTIIVHDTQAPVFNAPPADVTVECVGDVPAMTDLAWTDNCDGAGTVTGTDGAQIGGNCGGTITRTWTYTDACGNTATVTQTITIDDTTPPTASNPANTIVPGGPAPAVDPAVVIDEADNCGVPTVAFVSESSDNNPCPETITRIYSVTDDCGNTINVTHTILITDPFLPTASNPAPINVECIGDVPAPDPLVVTDEADNQGVPAVAWVSDVSDGLSCPETITRTYSVTDVCGGVITVEQTITVLDITAPVFNAPPANVTVECIGDVPAMADLGWTDNCDGTGTVTGSDVSDGLSCPETITRTWTYTDACGNTSTETQTITVIDTQAPVFNAPPANITVECIADVPAMTNLDWTDNCDGTGTVTGNDVSDGLSCPETITRTWTYTDACGNASTETRIITVHDTQAPVFDTPPADITIECVGNLLAANMLGWTDNCDGAGAVMGTDGPLVGGACGGTITRTWTYTDACGNTATVTQTITVDDTTPPTASNPATTTVPGGPAPAVDPTIVDDEADNCTLAPTVTFVSEVSDNNPCPETITRTYRVTDDCGNFIDVTHTILITDPIMPTATAPAAINVECIGDVPAADPLVITDEADNQGVPTVAWVGDVSDGQTCPETITRTYSITDVCGNVITVDQIITVLDVTPPTATAPATVNVECIGDVPVANIADITDEADNCTANPVVAHVGDVSDGLSCPETITRTYSITDDCGNSITVDQLIIVNDVTPPTATAPATVNVECIGDVPVANIADITDEADNCTANPVVAHVGDVSDGLSCPETITRTYSITDDCGNSITVDQLIIVNDVTPPTATAPATVNVECIGDVPAANIADITDEADNCTANPVVVHVGDVSDGLSCPETITRTYSITDDCGNAITVDQLIIVNDVTPPTATAPATVNVECIGDVPAANIADITDEADNCTVNPVVAHVGDVSDGLSCPETITRTYSITDDCGNSITVDQLIVVHDITLPTASAPATVNVECIGDVPAANIADITDEADNCTVNPVVAHVGDVSDGLSCPETITRTYSITDDCGNSITVDQLIIVNDVTPPTATAPATVNVECIGDVPVANIGDITDEADNCTANPVVVHVGDVSDGLSCPETITRTYSITDDCGNSITVDQLIIVNDVTPPTASNPADISVPGANDVPAPDPSVVIDEQDNCTVNPTVTWVSDVSDGNVCNLEKITRTYEITDDCGNSITVTQIITILAVPVPIDAGPDQTICDGDLVTLTAGNPTGTPIVWSTSGPPPVPNDGVAFAPTQTQMYTVTADNLGCISSDSVTITVEAPPAVSFVGDNLLGCSPLVVNFTNTSTAASGLTNCEWFVDGVPMTTGCGTVTHTFDTPGTYDITLTTTSGTGCTASTTYTDYIYVEADPVASFTASDYSLTNIYTTVQFTNTTVGAVDYSWDFGDNTGGSTQVNPSHEFPYDEGGSYVVQLMAYSPLGCVDSVQATISVEEEVIFYIPNTFTPDGDNYNEYFQAIFTSGYDPYDFELLIFNRWGEVIWESHDDAVGWDGTYGGELVQDGTYTWKIEFKTSETDERRTVKGHVNVIR